MIWPPSNRNPETTGPWLLRNTPYSELEFGALAPNAYQRAVISLTRRLPENWLGRRLAILLRKLVLWFLRRPLDMDVFGRNMRLFPFNNVCERRVLFTPQFFDRRERDLLASRLKPGFVFIDVGANVGAYSLFVSGVLDGKARIVAVEPQPRVFDRLTANIRFNPGCSIKAIDCAVADQDGKVSLFLDADNQGEASVKYMNWSGGEGASVSVKAKTLLGIAKDEKLERIDAIKLDVEGAEDLILVAFLRDAPEKLWPSLIVLENAPDHWQTDCVALLESKGYKLLARTRMNLVFERG